MVALLRNLCANHIQYVYRRKVAESDAFLTHSIRGLIHCMQPCRCPAHLASALQLFHVAIAVFRRTFSSSTSSALRTIHKLDSANSVVSCAVFFFSPR
ncbi:MAG: hypothetical protein H6R06_481 [Proteobacteria bacterium]|jgi:hypothetical protein|nr:hypothetical protein [Pseudomonadota bacterium]